MKAPIENRLQVSINTDALNGNSQERAVLGLQIQEAVYELRGLWHALAEKDKQIEVLSGELECCKLHPDEAAQLVTQWQKKAFAFEEDLAAARKEIERMSGFLRSHTENALRQEREIERLKTALTYVAQQALKEVEEKKLPNPAVSGVDE